VPFLSGWLRGVIDDDAARLDNPGRRRLEIFCTRSRYECMF